MSRVRAASRIVLSFIAFDIAWFEVRLEVIATLALEQFVQWLFFLD
jgi:hypothetical protein